MQSSEMDLMKLKESKQDSFMWSSMGSSSKYHSPSEVGAMRWPELVLTDTPRRATSVGQLFSQFLTQAVPQVVMLPFCPSATLNLNGLYTKGFTPSRVRSPPDCVPGSESMSVLVWVNAQGVVVHLNQCPYFHWLWSQAAWLWFFSSCYLAPYA